MIITTLRFGAITVALSLLLILSLTSPINADVYFGYNEEPENNPDRQNARVSDDGAIPFYATEGRQEGRKEVKITDREVIKVTVDNV